MWIVFANALASRCHSITWKGLSWEATFSSVSLLERDVLRSLSDVERCHVELVDIEIIAFVVPLWNVQRKVVKAHMQRILPARSTVLMLDALPVNAHGKVENFDAVESYLILVFRFPPSCCWRTLRSVAGQRDCDCVATLDCWNFGARRNCMEPDCSWSKWSLCKF